MQDICPREEYSKSQILRSTNDRNFWRETILLLPLIHDFFQVVSLSVGFIHVKKGDHVINISEHGWPKLLQFKFLKGQIFCMRWMFQCRTLLYNVSWIVSCLKGRYSTNLQTNCEAPYPTALITRSWNSSSRDHFFDYVNETNGAGMLRPGKGAFEQYSTFCVRECVVGEKKIPATTTYRGLSLLTIQYCHWIIWILGIFFSLHYYGLEILW